MFLLLTKGKNGYDWVCLYHNITQNIKTKHSLVQGQRLQHKISNLKCRKICCEDPCLSRFNGVPVSKLELITC